MVWFGWSDQISSGLTFTSLAWRSAFWSNLFLVWTSLVRSHRIWSLWTGQVWAGCEWPGLVLAGRLGLASLSQGSWPTYSGLVGFNLFCCVPRGFISIGVSGCYRHSQQLNPNNCTRLDIQRQTRQNSRTRFEHASTPNQYRLE